MEGMWFIWFLSIGGIIGWLAGMILGKDIPGGIFGNIIAVIIGAWIGGKLLGAWGPQISDFYILPALIGAIILVFIVSLFMKTIRIATSFLTTKKMDPLSWVPSFSPLIYILCFGFNSKRFHLIKQIKDIFDIFFHFFFI